MNAFAVSAFKLLLACCLLGSWASHAVAFGVDSKAPSHFAGLVLQANHVVIMVHPEQATESDETITVRDRAWIEAFAAVMESAIYQPTSSLLAIGFPVTFVAEDGRIVLNLQVLMAGHVRLNQRDFRLGSPTVGEIARLLRQAHEADAAAD